MSELDKGTWYQSAVSGLWYQSCGASGDVSAIRLNGQTFIPVDGHKEVAARIMQFESVIDQACKAMVTHVGLCVHYNLNPSDGSCEGCPSFSAKTCPIRMCLAGMNNHKAWEPCL